MISYLYIVEHLPNQALAFEHAAQMRRYKLCEHELDRGVKAAKMVRSFNAICDMLVTEMNRR